MTAGPKDAPNPAHAKETIPNTELLESHARNIPITAIRIRLILEITRAFFLSILRPMNFTRISFATEDEAARSCESAVDIVDARIPDRTTPAINAGKMPYSERRLEIATIMVSEAVPSRVAITQDSNAHRDDNPHGGDAP